MAEKMETLISRKETKANVLGVNIEVPSNRSVISFLLDNPISEGEQFNNDGYVYKDGKRLRKWFSHRDGWEHFWHPVREQLARIEDIYWRYRERSKRQWIIFKETFTKILATHHHVAHFYEKRHNCWGEFTVQTDDPIYGTTCRWNWLSKKPKKVRNKKLGQILWKIEDGKNYHSQLSTLLEDAIIDELRKKMPNLTDNDLGTVYDLSINGRQYFYMYSVTGHGGKWFYKMAWPLDKYEKMTFTRG